MRKQISKRVLALLLALFLLSTIPISVLAITAATADEAQRTVEQLTEQKKQRKADKSPSGNSSGIYISRTSENGEQYNKLGITVSKNEECTYDESSETYNYMTGKPAQINISISNQNAADNYKSLSTT